VTQVMRRIEGQASRRDTCQSQTPLRDRRVPVASFCPADGQEPTSTPMVYGDDLSREWQCWPLSAAGQMWRETTCDQFGCGRQARFVRVVDVLGDGRDSAVPQC
jgi:hypothetical protein